MASTTSLFTGLTGLNVHARRLDTISNNIANVSTTAFKSARMQFENMFSRTFSGGSSPGDTIGGTNPFQVGLGVSIAGVQRNFQPGALEATGDARDLAVDGDGFFVVVRDGSTYYTRAGAFRQDLNDNLVTVGGEKLQGYTVDENFNIVEGTLTDINIPVGKRTIAEQTENAAIAGNLNSDGLLPTGGSILTLGATLTGGFTVRTDAADQPTAPNVLEATTLLTSILDPAATDTITPLYQVGQSIRVQGATKGDATLAEATLAIEAGTTVQDLMDFLVEALGIHSTGAANPDGNTPGVTLDPLTGVITIVGNTGTVNDIDIQAQDIAVLDAAGEVVRNPIVAQEVAEADGESVRTTALIYDSLGTDVTVDVRFVLEDKSDTGVTWRYFVESGDDTDTDLRVSTGTVRFDNSGQLVDTTPITVAIDRADTGATTPLTFSLAFTGSNGTLTSLDALSQVANVFRDGLPAGVLETFGVQPDGTIFGGFSNGAVRTLGRVVLADFANYEGLVDIGGNNWAVGPNSGPAVLVEAGTFGTGGLVSGSLELSNVDLSKEFTDLILVQTGYSASARVIRTADELMQQLLVIGR
jgi:flagellar hook protein FlgE